MADFLVIDPSGIKSANRSVSLDGTCFSIKHLQDSTWVDPDLSGRFHPICECYASGEEPIFPPT